MTVAAWTLTVIGTFAVILAAFGMVNKDTKGAFLIVVGLIVVAAVLLVISGCAVSPERRPWLEAGFAYDTQSTVGGNPACVVRVRQPIGFGPIKPEWLVLGYQHISSCRRGSRAGRS